MTRGIEDETFVPVYNRWHCIRCAQEYLTVALAEGKTAMYMTCLRTQDCNGRAAKRPYSKEIGWGIPLLVEFVKPDRAEIRRVTNRALLKHFDNGGLMRRAVDTAPRWVKELV